MQFEAGPVWDRDRNSPPLRDRVGNFAFVISTGHYRDEIEHTVVNLCLCRQAGKRIAIAFYLVSVQGAVDHGYVNPGNTLAQAHLFED
jgi:hypothetical protein